MLNPLSNPDPARFEREVSGLVARTRPGQHRIVFIGSSTFTLWTTLDRDLGGLDAVNHGFGGSQLSDCIHYLDSLVLPYRPAAVVLYGGDNDLANGKSVDTVLGDYQRFKSQLRAALPQAVLYWTSIKISLARWALLAEQNQVNDAIEAETGAEPGLRFIDIRPVMRGADGRPCAHHFLEDGLHLSADGYAAWASVFRPQLQRDLGGTDHHQPSQP